MFLIILPNPTLLSNILVLCKHQYLGLWLDIAFLGLYPQNSLFYITNECWLPLLLGKVQYVCLFVSNLKKTKTEDYISLKEQGKWNAFDSDG